MAHFSCKGHSPEYDIDLNGEEQVDLITSSAVTFLFGWRYRSYPLFIKHEECIRRYFEFSDTQKAQSLIDQCRSRSKYILAVHVRHGDYRAFEGGKFFFSVDEYARVANQVAEQLGMNDTAIIVCSDEPKIDLSGFESGYTVNAPGSMITDMQALAFSDFIVAPPSTFSRWASFIGRTPLHVMDGSARPAFLSDFEIARC